MKLTHDETYLASLNEIISFGKRKGDRTGTGTRSRFGMQMRFDLNEGFPLLTTKKVHFKSIIYELLWFLRGDTNVRWLQDRGVSIWNEWADENGDLGPVYGKQWRSWSVPSKPGTRYSIDQLATVINTLKTNPDDRRMVVSAWNPADIEDMALPPCHLLFQFYVWRNQLSCQLYQRSADMFLGVPFNIASYAALMHMVAYLCELDLGEFIWTGGDCHIYNNHMEQVETQMERTPFASPRLTICNAPYDLDGAWDLEHFVLEGYECHPAIKAPVAV